MLSKFSFTLIIFIMAVPMMATDVFMPALTIITSDLHASQTFGSYILTIFMIGYGLGQMVFGPISDDWGRRPVLFLCLTITGISSFLIIFATIHTILIIRFIQGLFAGGVTVLGPAMVRDKIDDPKLLASKLSFVFAIIMLGPVIAPSIGGVLLQFLSWHYLFGITGIYISLVLLFALFLKKNKRKRKYKIQINKILAGYPKVIGNLPIMGLTLSITLLFSTIIVYLFSFAHIFENYYHLSIALSGILYGASAISIAISNVIVGIILKKPKANSVFLMNLGFWLAIAISIIGGILLKTSLIENPYVFLSIIVGLFFSYGFIFSPIMGLIMLPFKEFAGTVTGIVGVIETILGSLLATWIGSIFIINPTNFFGIMGILIAIAGILAWISYKVLIKENASNNTSTVS